MVPCLIGRITQLTHSRIQGLLLSDIKRSVESLRIKTKEMKEYPEFHKALLSKEFEMETFGQGLLEKVGVLRMSTLVSGLLLPRA